MDITNPGIIVFGKRYYRNNLLSQTPNIPHEKCNYVNEDFDEEPCDFEELNSIYDIKQNGSDFFCNINVASMFYGFIIGKKGESKKRIEMDTKTTITLPKQGQEGMIHVKGKTHGSVDRALTRIAELIDHGRSRLAFTHFFSIPANNQTIVKNFELFKSKILQNCIGDRGVTEKLFQKPFKLHLTLAMLVIGDHLELNNIIRLFYEFKSLNENLFNQPLRVHIKGIDYMNDDPCEVRVLYGKVDKSMDYEKLQMLADKLADFLFENHIISQKINFVTLHMTVLNASFLMEQDLALDTVDDSVDKTRNFDCSNIIKRYSDWDFGVLDINEIFLSKRYGGPVDSYYNHAASFRLN